VIFTRALDNHVIISTNQPHPSLDVNMFYDFPANFPDIFSENPAPISGVQSNTDPVDFSKLLQHDEHGLIFDNYDLHSFLPNHPREDLPRQFSDFSTLHCGESEEMGTGDWGRSQALGQENAVCWPYTWYCRSDIEFRKDQTRHLLATLV
jgi:hypothetical protein